MAILAARFFLMEDSLNKLVGEELYLVSPEVDLPRSFKVSKCELAKNKTNQLNICIEEELPENSNELVGKSFLIKSNIANEIFGTSSGLEAELLGAEVFDLNDRLIGKVKDVAGTSAQKHLVVSSGKKELLIPLVDEFIKVQKDNKIVMDLPKGLEELNGE